MYQKIAIVGLGKSGLSTLEYMKNSGAEIFAWDDNPDKYPNLTLTPPQKIPWHELDALILSPGIALTNPTPHAVVEMAKSANCPIICDIEVLYNDNPDATYIGITGTNGKSTTTALINHIAQGLGIKHTMGGNIGVPVLDTPKMGEDGAYILEMSSYQLDLIDKTRFNVAVLLNITPDHLDRHGDMAGYTKAKERIFTNSIANDTAVIATDDNYTRAIYNELRAQGKKAISVSAFDDSADIYVGDGCIFDNLNNQKHDLGDLQYLPGKHNAQNIAAAYGAIVALGSQYDGAEITKGAQTFTGLAHRMQFITEIDGVTFINDSKATNAIASQQALSSYKNNIYWIAGGVAKAGGIEPLTHLFSRTEHTFLIGQCADDFAKTLSDNAAQYTICDDLEQATTKAYQAAKKTGGVVLLSPACASFDQFKSFEQRGEKFCEIVSSL